jgi:hypothetical protein
MNNLLLNPVEVMVGGGCEPNLLFDEILGIKRRLETLELRKPNSNISLGWKDLTNS